SLTESFTLGVLGGALALVIAGVGTKLLVAATFRGAEVVPIDTLPDLRVLAFTLILSAVAVLMFGVLPTLHIATEIAPGMKGAGDEWSGHRRGRLGIGAMLIIGEAALSVVVLTGAGALVRSLENLGHQSFGFDHARVLTLNIDPARAGYDHQHLAPLYHQLEEHLNALPGVTSASFSTYSPLNECCSAFTIVIDGYTPKQDERTGAMIDRGSPRYFETIGTRLLRGRTFDAHDTPDGPPVAVVSEAFVRRFFPHDDPIGRRFGFGGNAMRARDLEIIGVVEDAKYDEIRADAVPTAFLPLLQAPPNPIGVLTETDFANVIEIRTAGRPDALAGEVRAALTGIDPELSVLRVATVADHLSNALSQDDIVAALATFFGLLALVLTCVGLYGLTAFGVSRRTSEIGLRMALGARRSAVTGMVIGRVLTQGAIGALIGVPIAFISGRLIASQLYGVSPTDPRYSALAAVGLILCITIAGLIPARRAARIDPIQALRSD
ncbi:MAG TPA: FtsX-like permease family protein, partial [Vicinamibacterales bacterium]